MIAIAMVLGAVLAALAARRAAGLRRTVTGLTVVTGLAVVAIGCGGSAHPAAPPAAVARAHSTLSWGDGYDHVVVYAAGRDLTASSSVGVANPAGQGRGLPRSTSTTQPLVPETLIVERLDGTTESVAVPAESLVAIAPRTPAESASLAAASTAAGFALLVVDRDGIVGAPGAAYVLSAGRLEQVAAAAEPTTSPAAPAAGASTSTALATTQGGATSTGMGTSGDDAFLAALRAAPGVVSATPVGPGVAAVATTGGRAPIEALPQVARVADDVLLDYADDPRQGEQWALVNTGSPAQTSGTAGTAGADSRAPRAWTVSQGAGVIVAVVDSGVDLTHPDLAGRLWTNPGEVCGNGIDDDHDGKVDDCAGWDFGTNRADPSPDPAVTGSDHGTHVTGIIAAGRNNVGIAGVAPLATVMPLKVASATGAISSTAVFAAVIFAVDHGAKVINLSLATRPGTARSAVTALENAVVYARAAGVTVVTGAGNDGVDITPASRAVWPAGFSTIYDNVIAVGATTNTDQVASFSNFGDPVTMYAPGAFLLSTTPGSSYAFQSGTSQAAAMVSGAVADVIAAGLATTPAAIRTQLTATAATIPNGYRLDVAAAVGIPPDPVVTVTYHGADSLAPDTTGPIAMTVQAVHMPSAVASVRLSIAAAVNYQVFAVQGVSAVVSPAAGSPVTTASDSTGAFAPLPISDPTALAGSGWQATISTALPTGDYALISELLDAGGQPMAGAQVAYLTVGAGTPVVTTTAPATTGPATTRPASGSTTTSTGSTLVATTTTGSPITSTTGGAASTTTATSGATTSTTTAGGSTTTTIASGVTTTTGPGSTSTTALSGPSTTTAAGSTTSTTGPSTSAPAPTTTASGSTTTTVAATTTTGPGTTTPTTTPTPPGQSQGIYRIDTVSPRYATLAGGTTITIAGAFPTTIPVDVWFGNKGIVQVTSQDGSTLVLATPAVLSTGVTDVSVRFALDTQYTLTLTQAFTFGTAPAATTTTVRGATTTTTRAPSATTTTVPTGGATTTTRAAATTTTRGATSTTLGVTTTTGTGPTTTRAGATTTTRAVTSSTTPLPTALVHLLPAPSTGAVARLSTTGWPRPGCRQAACPASPLP